MGRRESQGCRRMVAPSVGGCRREAGLVLRAAPAGRYQWVAVWVADARGPASGWCLLLRRMGLVGSSAFQCALYARACADGGAGSPGGGGLRRPRCGWGPAGGPHACCCVTVIPCYASRFFFPLAANMCRPTIMTRPSRCCLDINHRHACHQDTALRLPSGLRLPTHRICAGSPEPICLCVLASCTYAARLFLMLRACTQLASFYLCVCA